MSAQKIFILICVSLFLISRVSLRAEASTISILNSLPIRPGDTLVIGYDSTNTPLKYISLNNEKYYFFGYREKNRALIPLSPVLSIGEYTLTLDGGNETSQSLKIVVSARNEKVIILPLPQSLGVAPNSLGAVLKKQNLQLASVAEANSLPVQFNQNFGLPLANNRYITSRFGEIRRTGSESIRHLGVDESAPRGTRVFAINAGKVVAAYADPIYGNTVIINHGAEISSLYMHLDSISVKNGRELKKGELIGKVGSSGLASAAHLHLSIKIKGKSVDPLQFIRDFR